jgi:hypothetical protein
MSAAYKWANQEHSIAVRVVDGAFVPVNQATLDSRSLFEYISKSGVVDPFVAPAPEPAPDPVAAPASFDGVNPSTRAALVDLAALLGVILR